ncbi:hypothetical protein Tco_0443156 [Tanacetum coccineum]
MQTVAGDGITIIKRRRRDLYSDGIRDLMMASKRGRPKETLEDFVSRDCEDHFTCERIQIFYDHVDYTTQMAIDYAAGGRLGKLRPEEAWKTIKDLAQYKEEEWNEPESPDYIDANLEHELERFTFPKRPYQEEFEGRILSLIDQQEDQVRQLEEDMRKTKDTFMCFVDSLIATLKDKIEVQRAYSIKIEKITRFPTYTPTVTPETLKPTMVHRVSMISKIEPTNNRTPHQYLNSNLKMPLLHSFEENKLEYEDEDAVEIKMMGTGG